MYNQKLITSCKEDLSKEALKVVYHKYEKEDKERVKGAIRKIVI
jgi:hypothetical protein